MEQSKRIAILTGATGGLGYAFMKELIKESVDEIWAIGRTTSKIQDLEKEFGEVVLPLSLDLTKSEDLNKFNETLNEQKPQIMFLINNAGIAQMKQSKDLQIEEIENTVNLNCKAPVILTNFVFPICAKAVKLLTCVLLRHFSQRLI